MPARSLGGRGAHIGDPIDQIGFAFRFPELQRRDLSADVVVGAYFDKGFARTGLGVSLHEDPRPL